MYKIKNYIGFLILLLFITGVNISTARDHDNDHSDRGPDVKEAMPPAEEIPEVLPVIKSEEERYTLILNEVNRCQASIMHIAKFINVTDAVISGIDAENELKAHLAVLREQIRGQFATLNLYEEEAINKLQKLDADISTINASALQHFEYIMGMGTNFYNGAHTNIGKEGLDIFLLTILDIIGECQPTINRYLSTKIQE
jgi:hypothetical protein